MEHQRHNSVKPATQLSHLLSSKKNSTLEEDIVCRLSTLACSEDWNPKGPGAPFVLPRTFEVKHMERLHLTLVLDFSVFKTSFSALTVLTRQTCPYKICRPQRWKKNWRASRRPVPSKNLSTHLQCSSFKIRWSYSVAQGTDNNKDVQESNSYPVG